MSLEEVSQKTGIRKQYLEKIENGEAFGLKTTQFFIIACALKVKPHVLAKNL